MAAYPSTYILYSSIDGSVVLRTFQVQSFSEANALELAIRNGEWWCDPADPSKQYHLTGIVRYDVTSP